MLRIWIAGICVVLLACATTKVTVIGNSTQKELNSRSVTLCKDSSRVFIGNEFSFPRSEVDTIKIDQSIQRQLVYSTVFLSTLVLSFRSIGPICRSMYPDDPDTLGLFGGKRGDCYLSAGYLSVLIDGLIVAPLATIALVDKEKIVETNNIPACKK